MALIKINGVALPTPTALEVGIMDISKAERNAKGKMIIERVATKRKLFFTYSFLNEDDASTVLRAVSPTFYNVTYFDPQEKTMKSGSFYCGDRQLGMVDYIDGVPRFKDLSFDLIER
jgi:hypothetical protein